MDLRTSPSRSSSGKLTKIQGKSKSGRLPSSLHSSLTVNKERIAPHLPLTTSHFPLFFFFFPFVFLIAKDGESSSVFGLEGSPAVTRLAGVSSGHKKTSSYLKLLSKLRGSHKTFAALVVGDNASAPIPVMSALLDPHFRLRWDTSSVHEVGHAKQNNTQFFFFFCLLTTF